MISHQMLIEKVCQAARKFEVEPPEIKLMPSEGSDQLLIRPGRHSIILTERALEELTEGELDFGLALCFVQRFKPRLLPLVLTLAPITLFTVAGLIGIYTQRVNLEEQLFLAFAILMIVVFIGFLGSVIVNFTIKDEVRRRLFMDALLISGNASAAETYLIRCKTDDMLLSAKRRLKGDSKMELETELDTLRQAARRLGISYRSVKFFG